MVCQDGPLCYYELWFLDQNLHCRSQGRKNSSVELRMWPSSIWRNLRGNYSNGLRHHHWRWGWKKSMGFERFVQNWSLQWIYKPLLQQQASRKNLCGSLVLVKLRTWYCRSLNWPHLWVQFEELSPNLEVKAAVIGSLTGPTVKT